MKTNCIELTDPTLEWSSIISILLALALAAWNLYQHGKLKALQAQIDQKLLVHRLQFEAEFNAYREIWRILTDLLKQLQLLSPLAHNVGPSGYEETTKERIADVSDIANNLVTLVEQNRPFYSSNVNKELNALTRAIREEIFSALDVTVNLAYWEDKEKRFKKIVAAIESACAAIRQRVGTDKEL